MFHHDPGHDDATMDSIEKQAAAVRPGTIAAKEGLALDL
jgi:phosphoribosyl 1,2-cyclic phosphodiesterase